MRMQSSIANNRIDNKQAPSLKGYYLEQTPNPQISNSSISTSLQFPMFHFKKTDPLQNFDVRFQEKLKLKHNTPFGKKTNKLSPISGQKVRAFLGISASKSKESVKSSNNNIVFKASTEAKEHWNSLESSI